MAFLKKYLAGISNVDNHLEAIAYFATLDSMAKNNPQVTQAIIDEICYQRGSLKLIASENYSSLQVQLAMGNLLTDKYSEGSIKHRFYAGCAQVDAVEQIGVDLCKEIFGCDSAYVQPHSGADANLIAFLAILKKTVELKELAVLDKKSVYQLTDVEFEALRQKMINQKLLGMSLFAGGHLTHGSRVNISSLLFQIISYDVDEQTHLIDYKSLERQILKYKPLVLIVGYSAYTRLINFAKIKEITHKTNTVLMVDMAHFAGLVAGKAMCGEYDPVAYADIVTSTTHKTLRGPRGGLILCKKEYKEFVDKGCPHVIGGPLPNMMAAKVVAFREVQTSAFQEYTKNVVLNAKTLAEQLMKKGVKILTDGTDNHMVIVDVQRSFNLTGRQAEEALISVGMTLNRNAIPFDRNGAWYCSGIRLGSPALTSRGMRNEEMKKIADMLYVVLKGTKAKIVDGKKSKAQIVMDNGIKERVAAQIHDLLSQFALYPELGLDIESKIMV